MNLYAYVGNNATNGSDPNGLVGPAAAIAATCLANPEACAAVAYITYVGVCKATGGCQPLPLDELIPQSLPPIITLGGPPIEIPGHPPLSPRSPFFPPIPPLEETLEVCDPDTMPFPDTVPHSEPLPARRIREEEGTREERCHIAYAICELWAKYSAEWGSLASTSTMAGMYGCSENMH